MSSFFDSYIPTLLNKISPFLLDQGIFGRISNINDLKAISLVCKQWRSWIYDYEYGPFYSLGEHKIKVILNNPLPCGFISQFNQALCEKGLKWFEFVSNYKIGDSLEKLKYYDASINFIDDCGVTPLKLAIDVVKEDITKLPLLNYLIEQGADLFQETMTNTDLVLLSPLVQVFQAPFISVEDTLKLADVFISEGFDINFLSKHDGQAFLHQCHLFNEKDLDAILNWYKRKEGDLNILSRQGMTPLHMMIPHNRSVAVKLLEHGASASIPTQNGYFPLHLVLIAGETIKKDLFNEIIKQDPCQVYKKDRQGHLPLWYAIAKGKSQILKCLASHIDFNELENKHKLLSAFIIYVNDTINCFSWALSPNKYVDHYCGFPVSFPDEENSLTYFKNTYTFLLSIVLPEEFLKPDKNGDTFYHHLAKSSPLFLNKILPDRNSIEYKLTNRKGLSVLDLTNFKPNTYALIRACEAGDAAKVISIMQNLKNFNLHLNPNNPENWHLGITDSNNNSLIHLVINKALWGPDCFSYSKTRKYLNVLKLLLDEGLNPNHQNIYGDTPLHDASKGDDELSNMFITLLIDSGANPLIVNNEQERPLDYLNRYGCHDDAKLMTKKAIMQASGKKY